MPKSEGSLVVGGGKHPLFAAILCLGILQLPSIRTKSGWKWIPGRGDYLWKASFLRFQWSSRWVFEALYRFKGAERYLQSFTQLSKWLWREPSLCQGTWLPPVVSWAASHGRTEDGLIMAFRQSFCSTVDGLNPAVTCSYGLNIGGVYPHADQCWNQSMHLLLYFTMGRSFLANADWLS